MNIAIFGLGYVGVVSAACLARDGHQVIGVDPQEGKVAIVNEGRSPVVEKGLGELVAAGVRSGRLRATGDAAAAVAESDISIIAVGTPSRRNGSLETGAVERVAGDIGAALAGRNRRHTVVLRSTVLPGTTRGLVLPALAAASGTAPRLAFNPEFLREASALADYDSPPKTVVGATEPDVADEVLELYAHLPGPKVSTGLETAEMVKYADNTWHALKVAFANEIGTVAKATGADSHAVMDIFCRDRKLNISPAYLRPGFAFGGSCLPKDVRALAHRAQRLDLSLPLVESVMPANRRHLERALDHVLASGVRRVGLLGLSFKAGTDDLRESPLVALVELLIGKGIDLRIYDRDVALARLVGANRDYIVNKIPHISALLSDDLEAVVAHGEMVIVGHAAPEFAEVPAMLSDDQQMLDLVRLQGAEALGERYAGIAW